VDAFKTLKNLDKDDILAALGLQSSKSAAEYVLPVLGIFSAGILVGIGVGLLAAPKAGEELRREIGRQVNSVRDRAANAVEEATAN